MSAAPKIKLRCPKCKGQTFTVYEVRTETLFAEVVDGISGELSHVGNLESTISANGACKCGHQWRVRDPNSWDDRVTQPPAGVEK